MPTWHPLFSNKSRPALFDMQARFDRLEVMQRTNETAVYGPRIIGEHLYLYFYIKYTYHLVQGVYLSFCVCVYVFVTVIAFVFVFVFFLFFVR